MPEFPDSRFVEIVKESMNHWDALGKTYPDHLQAAVDQLKRQGSLESDPCGEKPHDDFQRTTR